MEATIRYDKGNAQVSATDDAAFIAVLTLIDRENMSEEELDELRM